MCASRGSEIRVRQADPHKKYFCVFLKLCAYKYATTAVLSEISYIAHSTKNCIIAVENLVKVNLVASKAVNRIVLIYALFK